jgi:hypothetical protein
MSSYFLKNMMNNSLKAYTTIFIFNFPVLLLIQVKQLHRLLLRYFELLSIQAMCIPGYIIFKKSN